LRSKRRGKDNAEGREGMKREDRGGKKEEKKVENATLIGRRRRD